MKHNCEILVDDNGIEILVGYQFEKEHDYMEEPGNPNTLVAGMVYTELESVEVIIAGKGIDILPQLTEKQKDRIIQKLNYEC